MLEVKRGAGHVLARVPAQRTRGTTHCLTVASESTEDTTQAVLQRVTQSLQCHLWVECYVMWGSGPAVER